MTHIAIIGGGIAGLATAFYLQKKSGETGTPIDYTLIESETRLGGKIVTEIADDFVVEGGADSFLTMKPGGVQLCRDLGLEDRLIPTNDHKRNVFVLRKGKLIPFPGGYRLTVPTEFIPFALSPLISPLGKLRMGLDLIIPPRKETGDESLASFIRRRLGEEALDKIAGPIMAGIYTADPERLSMQSAFPQFSAMERQHGSLIKAMQRAKKMRPPSGGNSKPPAMFTSLQGGMKELVDTLTNRLEGELCLGCRVASLSAQSPGFEITLDTGGQPITADAVILAVPAYVAANLMESVDAQLTEALKKIRHVSTANISLGYRRADVADQHDFNGFGFMVPKSENRQILACTWSSTKFDYRASADDILMRVFVGGDGKEHLVDLSDEELLKLAQAEIADIMGVTAPPVLHRVFRWINGNPQYDVGHLDRVSEIEKLAGKISGLHFTGSAFRGIGIPDCITSAQSTADQVLENC